MYVGNGQDVIDNLMGVQASCPNCGATLTFESAARLAKDHGVSENAIMCHDCHKVFNVNVTPNKMTILGELTHYNFSAQNTSQQNTVVTPNVPNQNNQAQFNQQQTQYNNIPPQQPQFNNGGDNINSVLKILFYKTDVVTGLPRLSKTKAISFVWFAFWFIMVLVTNYSEWGFLEFSDFLAGLFIGLIFTAPVFIIGWVIGKLIDRNSKKKAQIANQQYNQQAFNQPNNQYGANQQFNAPPVNNQAVNTPPASQTAQGTGVVSPEPVFKEESKVEASPEPVVKEEVKEEVSTKPADEDETTPDDAVEDKPKTVVMPSFAVKEEVKEEEKVETPVEEESKEEVSTEPVVEEEVKEEDAEPVVEEEPAVTEESGEKYYEKDNMGTRHDTVDKANGYWMGERPLKDEKYPFILYRFTDAQKAEDALLELPFIHKASDSGNLICDDVYIFGCYKVAENNYEAIVCGKELKLSEFKQAEDAFSKHGGSKINILEPEESSDAQVSDSSSDEGSESSVKFREKFNRDQFTYECYDANTKNDAMEFLKTKEVNQRLYYICVYTPEGDFGRDIDGIYQM